MCTALNLREKYFSLAMDSKTGKIAQNVQPVTSHASHSRRAESSNGKAAYSEMAFRASTARICALEKELLEMQKIVSDTEKRRHEAEAKTCIAQRKVQDSEVRFSISDKRRKDAEEKARELEAEITYAISVAQKSDLLVESGGSLAGDEAAQFNWIRRVFDKQAFEESKRRIDAEHKAYEVTKKRAEAEAKYLEETERRVQAEIRAKQETRARIDEEVRSKDLRNKLKDAEEKLKMVETQKVCERRKKVEHVELLENMLKRAQDSLLQAEHKWKKAEEQVVGLEQQISLAHAEALDCERKLEHERTQTAELREHLERSRADIDRKLGSNTEQLEMSLRCVAELQTALADVSKEVKTSMKPLPMDTPQDSSGSVEEDRWQDENGIKIGELQTLNADLEVTNREIKQKLDEHVYKCSELKTLNAGLEAIVYELKQRLEEEGCAKLHLQGTIEELEDTVREQSCKLNQVKPYESSAERRVLSDALSTLRVEENPLFRPEPVSDGLPSNFLSRPDSVTDDSQLSAREGPESATRQSQVISFPSPSSDSEMNVTTSPKSHTDNEAYMYHQEEGLLQKIQENETLIMTLRESERERIRKQSQLEAELEEALRCKLTADAKVEGLMRQLELALQREKERDREFQELPGTTSIRGKKEKWGILDRFRSKTKSENL